MSSQLVRAVLQKEWTVARHLLGTPFPLEWRDDGWQWLEWQASRGESDERFIVWGTRLAFPVTVDVGADSGPVVAEVGFHGPPDSEGWVEIGYRVVAEYRRRGLAEEATAALLAWAVAHGVTGVRASVSPDNAASIGLPGWVPVDDDVQRERFAAIVAADEWVLDTAYAAWKDLVLQRCQLVVGLDYPRWLSLARLVRRTLIRLVDRRPICNGNVESLRGTLSRDSILVWHFRSFSRKRARMRAWAASEDVPILLFRRPAELERWLASLERDVDRSSPSTPTPTPGPVR